MTSNLPVVSTSGNVELGYDRVSSPIATGNLKLNSDIIDSPCPYSTKSLNSSPMSLNSMLGRRSPRKTTFSQKLIDVGLSEPADLSVSSSRVPVTTNATDPSEIDYGYGYGYGPGEPGEAQQGMMEAPVKRRRYQRRNSKTPQMLMAMTSSLRTFDILKELEKNDFLYSATGRSKSDSMIGQKGIDIFPTDINDDLDGGLAMAEELVMQLQKRRRC